MKYSWQYSTGVLSTDLVGGDDSPQRPVIQQLAPGLPGTRARVVLDNLVLDTRQYTWIQGHVARGTWARQRYIRSVSFRWKAHLCSCEIGSSASSAASCLSTFLMTSLGSAMPVIEHTSFTVDP